MRLPTPGRSPWERERYTLSGTGFSSPLPSLVWSFDTTAISSGEQHTLSVQLSAPAPVSAAGSLTLTFTPSTTVVTDDAAVQFVATSKRVASFTIHGWRDRHHHQRAAEYRLLHGNHGGHAHVHRRSRNLRTLREPVDYPHHPVPAPIAISSTGATSRANEARRGDFRLRQHLFHRRHVLRLRRSQRRRRSRRSPPTSPRTSRRSIKARPRAARF